MDYSELIEQIKKDHPNIVMIADLVEEAGYMSALGGLGHNKKQPQDRGMHAVAVRLAPMDGGHNKFLESIYVWLNVKAPRYWWQEADTFRLSTKQSESTMHTLNKELAELAKLQSAPHDKDPILSYMEKNFEPYSCGIDRMHKLIWEVEHNSPLYEVKKRLPEGFLQKRMWCMNYKCLRNIILQRRTHRLPHWHLFILQVLSQVDHPEFLPDYR